MDTNVTDGCTGIPDVVFGVDISICCEEHDTVKPCKANAFYRCLKYKLRRLWLSGSLALAIAVGGTVGCWVKYPREMWGRL